MFQRILVPLDGTRCAERAIPVAAHLARLAGGSIVFVRVVLPPVETGKYAPRHSAAWEHQAYEKERAEASSYLANMMLTYSDVLRGLETDMGIARGLVPPTICSVAQKEHAEMIVMCSKGETGFKRWLFGSVAQEVTRRSSLPVLVLKQNGASFLSPNSSHSSQKQ